MVTTRPPKTIVKPTALGPVANTDTKLLIYGLFQKGRVLAQDWVADGAVWCYPVSAGNLETQVGTRVLPHTGGFSPFSTGSIRPSRKPTKIYGVN